MKKTVSILLCIAINMAFIPLAFAENTETDANVNNIPVITKQPSDIHMSYEDAYYGKTVPIDIEAYIPNGDEVYYEIYSIDENNKEKLIDNHLDFVSFASMGDFDYHEYKYFVRVYDKNSFGDYVDSDIFVFSHEKAPVKFRIEFYASMIGYSFMLFVGFVLPSFLSPISAPFAIAYAIIKKIINR